MNEQPHTEHLSDATAATVPRPRAARRLFRAQVLYSIALALFAVLAAFAYVYAYFGWDLRVTRFAQSFDAPAVAGAMQFVSLFGNRWIPYALTAIVCLIFLALRRRSEAAGLLLSAGGGAIVNAILKTLVARPRPTAALVHVSTDLGSRSFPSGHVTFYVTFFGFLFFVAYAVLKRGSFLRSSALSLAALPVFLIGLSRVYLGAHWTSDTIGAYLAGGVWLAFSLEMYRRWKRRATLHTARELQEEETQHTASQYRLR